MVRTFMSRRFFREDGGVVLVEAMLVVPVLMLVLTTMIELSLALFQWNQTVKAVQLGARLAAVSSPLADDMSALEADYPTAQGGPTPAASVSVSCGAGTTACNAAQMSRLIFGSDGVCDPNIGASLAGVCDFNPRITAANLLITYHRTGLGYVGRPAGPVVTVTVETRNLTFDFLFLGFFLGQNQLVIPSHPVTITSEDLLNCKTPPCA